MALAWWVFVAAILVAVVVDWCCLEMARRTDNTEEEVH